MRLTRLASAVVLLVLAGGSIAAAFGMLARPPTGSGLSSSKTGLSDLTTSHPRPPDHLAGPARQTIATRTARFTWRDTGKRVVGFRCSLDAGPFAPCRSGIVYSSLSAGRHTFALVAINRHGRRSRLAHGNTVAPAASWIWTILPAQRLRMIGSLDTGLYPGAPASPIDLALDNPHRYPLQVYTASVRVEAVQAPRSAPGLPCGPSDFAVSGYRGAAFRAPPGASTLQGDGVPISRWPAIRMVDRPHDQDGCMGATVVLAYRGLATKPTAGG